MVREATIQPRLWDYHGPGRSFLRQRGPFQPRFHLRKNQIYTFGDCRWAVVELGSPVREVGVVHSSEPLSI